MKAITLFQPWATLVALGAKTIETRSWPTNYRGKLMIHVSKKCDVDPNLWWTEPFKSALMNELVFIGPSPDHAGFDRYSILKDNFHLGCVIAECDLIDCLSTEGVFSSFGKYWIRGTSGVTFQIGDDEFAFGDFLPGRYLFFLKNIHRLATPIPARGFMNLWDWEGEYDLRSECG